MIIKEFLKLSMFIIVLILLVYSSVWPQCGDNPADDHIELGYEFTYFGRSLPSMGFGSYHTSSYSYDYIVYHTIWPSLGTFWSKVDTKKSQGHITGLTTGTNANSVRCPIHNTAAGGVPGSRHQYGNAADVAIGTTYNQVKEGFVYTEDHTTWAHVDLSTY